MAINCHECCDVCRLHVSQKHQEKQHTCTECDKSFLYFHQLRIHMAHHARRSIYPCKHCDQEFTRLAELRAHSRQEHQGAAADGESQEKKSGHSCPECDFHAPTRYVYLHLILMSSLILSQRSVFITLLVPLFLAFISL